MADNNDIGRETIQQAYAEIEKLRRALHEIENKLEEAEQRFRQLTVQTRSITWEVDLEGVFTYVSSNVSQEWGYRLDELVGRMKFYDLYPEMEREMMREEWMSTIRSGKALSGFENSIVTKDGRIRWLMTAGSPELDDQGRVVGYKGIDTDITAYKEAENQIRYLATHDHMTGLPGLSLAKERMSQALGLTRRRGDMLAIMVINLDNFKRVNDNWGHDTGDKVLRTVAERLRGCLRATDTAARIGGDEFVIMASALMNRQDALKIVAKLEQAISQPIYVQTKPVSVGASIGLSMYPEDGDDVEALIRSADDAMYKIKAGRSGRQRD